MKIGFMLGHIDHLSNAKILIKSINKFLPVSKEDIFIVIPDTVKICDEFENITKLYFHLPSLLKDLPFGDKIMAAKVFEDAVRPPYLWCDVDSIFLNEPCSLKNIQQGFIGVNPVDKRNIGCLASDHYSPLWKDISASLNLPLSKNTVSSQVDHQKIYPYYNIGMVYNYSSYPLFSITAGMLKKYLSKTQLDLLSTPEKIFLHQVVFSLVLQADNHILALGDCLNQPLHLFHEYPQIVDITKLESIRYDTYFHHPLPFWLLDVVEQSSELTLTWYY